MSRERLRELIERDALRRGKEFRLSSGDTSTVYFDGKKVTLDGEGNHHNTEEMFALIVDLFPTAQAIGGTAMGANFIVPPLIVYAFERHYPFSHGFIVYEEDGIAKIANPPAAGTRVVLVDDATTTGSSFEKARTAIPECTILGGVVMVDRSLGQAEQRLGFPITSVFTIVDFDLTP